MPYFCRFEMSMYHGDLQIHHHRKNALQSFFLLIHYHFTVSGYLLIYFNWQLILNIRSMFPFHWWNILRSENLFDRICTILPCDSGVLLQFHSLHSTVLNWAKEKPIQDPTSSYACIKGVIASSNVYVCSVCICLALQTLTCPLLSFHTFLPVYSSIRFFWYLAPVFLKSTIVILSNNNFRS